MEVGTMPEVTQALKVDFSTKKRKILTERAVQKNRDIHSQDGNISKQKDLILWNVC